MPLPVLKLRDLAAGSLSRQLEKVVERLAVADFRSADVKKLRGTSLYRAKLDDKNRLLFKIGEYEGNRHLLVLEIVRNHAYEKARFLSGGSYTDDDFVPVELASESAEAEVETLTFINRRQPTFHMLDKVLSFDEDQNQVFEQLLPLIVIGPAGSGKTALTLEKLKTLPGHGLYLTRSAYLVDNASSLYQANGYTNEGQEIDFLSLRELIETIDVPQGREATYRDFAGWFARMRGACKVKATHKIYEEIKGVITGTPIDQPWMSLETYRALGVRQSIFLGDERVEVYRIFERWRERLAETGLTEANMLAWDRLAMAEPIYDFLVVDEVQDITNVELALALRTLKDKRQFLLCGDSNQIVHPNLFSWAKIKALFYQDRGADFSLDSIHILRANYRNARDVTELANRLLRLKQRRFGSIDRESNYIVESVNDTPGRVELLVDSARQRREIDTKTARSTRYAIIVLRDEDKKEAQAAFSTPLVFSIQEAKGLEYQNVILFNFVSAASKDFRECAIGVTADDLSKDLAYARARDKTDKSLDAYKFYINALYVALTRAVRNVLIIERETTHPLWETLGPTRIAGQLEIAKDESSRDDWQREARKLELQGKTEQAEQIRQDILEIAPVPWTVVTVDNVEDIRHKATGAEPRDKAAQQQLFEYAVTYAANGLLPELVAAKFRHAKKPASGREYIDKTYYADYRSKRSSVLENHVAKYGIDFRNPLNETPLMVAAKVGRPDLVKKLLQDGAAPNLVDTAGRNAWRVALSAWLYDEGSFKPHVLEDLFIALKGCPIKVKVGRRMVKLESKSMEWFLVNVFLVVFRKNAAAAFAEGRFPAMRASTLEECLRVLPLGVLPQRRRRRPYISSILAKNEVFGNSPYNRRLFLRVQRGFYVLNPALEISIKDEWVSVGDLLNLKLLVAGLGPRASMRTFESMATEMRKRVLERVETVGSHQGHRPPARKNASAEDASAVP